MQKVYSNLASKSVPADVAIVALTVPITGCVDFWVDWPLLFLLLTIPPTPA